MKYFKNNWAFLIIAAVSLLMGILAVVTAFKLRSETAVAPTVPTHEFASEAICRRSVRFHVGSPLPLPSIELFTIPASDSATQSGQTVASSSSKLKAASSPAAKSTPKSSL
jgi:hypothetical protein